MRRLVLRVSDWKVVICNEMSACGPHGDEIVPLANQGLNIDILSDKYDTKALMGAHERPFFSVSKHTEVKQVFMVKLA